jgi:choline dehydrogenase
VRKRPNLEVRCNALVTNVEFAGTRAVGVRYRDSHGKTSTVHAGEVVLCGGPINTPQVLQLSGVGNARHLESLGVPVVHELPGSARTCRTISPSTCSTRPASRSHRSR